MNALIASASVPAPTPVKTIWLRCAGVPVRYRRMIKKREKRETRLKRTVSASRIWVFAVFEVCESGFQAARATPNDGHRRVAVDCDFRKRWPPPLWCMDWFGVANSARAQLFCDPLQVQPGSFRAPCDGVRVNQHEPTAITQQLLRAEQTFAVRKGQHYRPTVDINLLVQAQAGLREVGGVSRQQIITSSRFISFDGHLGSFFFKPSISAGTNNSPSSSR